LLSSRVIKAVFITWPILPKFASLELTHLYKRAWLLCKYNVIILGTLLTLVFVDKFLTLQNKGIYCQSVGRRLFIDAANESRQSRGISF